MRHLDANALAQLIGAMADVVAAMASAPPAPATDLPTALTTAIRAFDDGWRPASPTVPRELEAQVEHLAAAGMAFIEGDPVTAEQLVTGPVAALPDDGSGLRSALPAATLRARIGQLQSAAGAAERVVADLKGRRLARRAFTGAEGSIQAFRAFAAGYRAAADALASYMSLADAALERRRVVDELLDDASRATDEARTGSAQAVAGSEQVARLRHKARAVSGEADASVDACVAALRAAVPTVAELATIHDGLQLAVDAVRGMLADAAASELERRDPTAPSVPPISGDRRSVA